MSLTSPHYRRRSKCSDRTTESVYTTTQSAHPQCATGMQSISETRGCWQIVTLLYFMVLK